MRRDDPARINVRVNNWNTKAANSMEWRSFLVVVTTGDCSNSMMMMMIMIMTVMVMTD